jgi:hypothetical protein
MDDKAPLQFVWTRSGKEGRNNNEEAVKMFVHFSGRITHTRDIISSVKLL